MLAILPDQPVDQGQASDVHRRFVNGVYVDTANELEREASTASTKPSAALSPNTPQTRRRAGYYERTRNEVRFEVETYRRIPLIQPTGEGRQRRADHRLERHRMDLAL